MENKNSFSKSIENREKIIDPKVLGQIKRDKKSEAIIQSFIGGFTPDNSSYESVELDEVIEENNASEFREDIERILAYKYDIHFYKNNRQRNRSRSR